MKNQISASARILFASLAAIPCAYPISAQTYVEDTLAVRVLLDENGLLNVSVPQVSQTDTSGRVTVLDLSARKIVTLTSEIGVLTGLKSLMLADNLIDSLPAEMWALDRLINLDLGGNKVARLDAGVGRLKNLVLLGLSRNGLAALPPEAYTLEQLETLLLDGNALDTLSDSVANLVFLKYLDIAGNQLRTVPYTLAAMEMDSLDLSANVMTTLPDLITAMSPATRVHLGDNRLCDLSPDLEAWADGKDPAWKATQTCGAAVRPGAQRTVAPLLRAFSDAEGIRLDFPGLGNMQGTYDVALRTASGRTVFRRSVSGGTGGAIRVQRGTSGLGGGFLWAELISEGKPMAAVAVPPSW